MLARVGADSWQRSFTARNMASLRGNFQYQRCRLLTHFTFVCPSDSYRLLIAVIEPRHCSCGSLCKCRCNLQKKTPCSLLSSISMCVVNPLSALMMLPSSKNSSADSISFSVDLDKGTVLVLLTNRACVSTA